jgi:hypothetical protein
MTSVIGRGWATVELDRAADELVDLLVPGRSFMDAHRSAVLGAACRVGPARAGGDATWIVLLEPDTEGRLAETLARYGEGWAAVWEVDAVDDDRPAGETGPLGSERLAGGTAAARPFRLVLEAATIER